MALPLHVALLEDDVEMRERVFAPGLRNHGFDVACVGTAAELDVLLADRPVDIVVLDLGLPGEDGFSVAQRLRNANGPGIVMLTARHESADRIRGLSDGADAFLSKPVILGELAATLHSVARRLHPRTSENEPTAWRLIDDGWSLVSPANQPVALTLQERTVMGLLSSQRGRAVDRATLIAALAKDPHDFDPHRLEMIFHRLRGKIADLGDGALPVRAVRGIGYMLR